MIRTPRLVLMLKHQGVFANEGYSLVVHVLSGQADVDIMLFIVDIQHVAVQCVRLCRSTQNTIRNIYHQLSISCCSNLAVATT